MRPLLLALPLALGLTCPALAHEPQPPPDDDRLEIAMVAAAGAVTAVSLGLLISTELDAADLSAEPPDASKSEELARLSTQRNWALGATVASAGLTALAVALLIEVEAPFVPVASATGDGGLLGITGRF